MSRLFHIRAKSPFPLGFIVTCLGFLDTHLLIPIIALYAASLGAEVGMIGLIIGLYSIANTPANVVFGRLIDRIGYRRPLIIGLIGDAIAMFSYAMCSLPFHLALVRIFHGMSGGVVGPATMSVTAEHASRNKGARIMGFYGMAMAGATLLGYGLSAALAYRLGYNFIFYVGSAMLVIGAFIAIVMPEVRNASRNVSRIPLRDELKGMVGLLRRKGLVTSYFSIFTQYFAFGAVVTLLPLYVESLGLKTFHVGILLGIFALTFFVLQFPSGIFSDRVGRRLPITSALGLCVFLLVIMPVSGTFYILAIVMCLYGGAYALLFPSISALVSERTSAEERGGATGVFHALLTMGVAVGAPVMGGIAQIVGVRAGLALCAAVAAVAMAIAWIDLGQKSVHRSGNRL